MNPRLLNDVRSLKLSGITDQEISTRLQSSYSTADIQQALTALKDIRPQPAQVESHSTQQAPTQGSQQTATPSPASKRRLPKMVLLVLPVPLAGALLFLSPVILKTNSSRTTATIDAKLQAIFDTELAYKIDSQTWCDDITVINKPYKTLKECYRTSAYAYFPNATFTDQTNGRRSQTNAQRIDYVTSKGEPLDKYLETGQYTQKGTFSNRNNRPLFVELGLQKSPDELTFSYLTDKVKLPAKKVGRYWKNEREYSYENTVSLLQERVSAKVENDEELTDQSPTPGEAEENNKAPVVVYYTDQYCHGLRFYFLNTVCFLPD